MLGIKVRTENGDTLEFDPQHTATVLTISQEMAMAQELSIMRLRLSREDMLELRTALEAMLQ